MRSSFRLPRKFLNRYASLVELAQSGCILSQGRLLPGRTRASTIYLDDPK